MGVLDLRNAVGLCCRVATGSSDAALGGELAEHGVYAQKRWECGGGEERQMWCTTRAYCGSVQWVGVERHFLFLLRSEKPRLA
jgi:hypothetical protein